MRVVLSNVGSTGDVQPFLALAVEFQRHGHRPLLALPSLFAERAARLGLEFTPIGPPLTVTDAQRIMAAMLSAATPMGQMRHFLAATMPWIPQMYQELRQACRDADMLVAGVTQPAARMLHETEGIPFVSVPFTPFAVPTGYRLPAGLPALPPSWRLARRLNRAAWQLILAPMRWATAPIINRYRVQLGLPPAPDPLLGDVEVADLALFAVSRHVVRPEPDWPPRYHLTGYFFLDADEGWRPDPELLEFLAAGPPPVVVTFGSMLPGDPRRLTAVVLEALERVGCRAIIQQGWGGLATGSLPPSVRAVGFVPHAWLFPHAACVVHHGGAGTTAAVFRAGVPAVVVPFIADQFAWATTARELGCAGRPVYYRWLTPERLARAIAQTLATPRYARSATRLGEQIRAEDGVGTARRLLEALVASRLAARA